MEGLDRPHTRRQGSNAVAAIDEDADEIAVRLRADLTLIDNARRHLSIEWRQLHDMGVAMLVNAEGTVAHATTASRSAATVSVQMQHVAAATEEMTAMSREIASNAAQAAETAHAGAAHTARATETMTELSAATHHVQDVVDVIQGTAARTRILALNATIEAARAGSAGHGFAVVASNVKGLSTQTADATVSITDTVRDINTGTLSAAQVMSSVRDPITAVNDNQGAIASAVEQQTATAAELGQATQLAAADSVALAEGRTTDWNRSPPRRD